MKSKEQKLLEHDDALVKRARVLLFTRASATCFAVLMFVGLIMHAIHAAKYLPADANSTSVFVVATDTGNIGYIRFSQRPSGVNVNACKG